MTPTAIQISLIQRTYAEIREREESFSALFYHRLLQAHPFTRVLFPDDMTDQIDVFGRTLDALVERVEDFAAFLPALSALAIRHVSYGVKRHHYAAVGDVLIATFAEILGEKFTVDVEDAWTALYNATSGAMIREAYQSN